jgi:hypothetical protein
LSIRDGRRLWVRRAAFRREVQRDKLVGGFALKLEARSPFEEAMDAVELAWAIDESPTSRAFATAGSVAAAPVFTVAAGGDLVRPAFTDGARTIQYDGVVAAGSVIVVDCANARLTIDGADATPYGLGDYPRIDPEETVLTYTDDPASSHSAAVQVVYRDRWW